MSDLSEMLVSTINACNDSFTAGIREGKRAAKEELRRRLLTAIKSEGEGFDKASAILDCVMRFLDE